MDNAYRVITQFHRLDDDEGHTDLIYTLDGALLLHRARDASFQAREALTKAEHDRYVAEMSNTNPQRFQKVAERLYATQAAATLREQEESSLLRERSAIEAERKRRMQMREAAVIADRDRRREAQRRANILAGAAATRPRSLVDRMKEAVIGAGAARSPADL